MLWDKGVGIYVEAAKRIKETYPNAKFQLLGFVDTLNPSVAVRDRVHRLDQVADAIARHGHAEPELRLDLVALRNRDLAHVVPEPRDCEAVRLAPARRCPGPDADPLAHARLAPVADNGLPHEAHPRLHERELPVAVRRLVQVHEVHVDLAPGEIAVELRVEVQEGPGGRRAPRSTSSPARRCASTRSRRCSSGRVGLDEHGADRLGRRRDRLADDPHGDLRRGVERRGDLGRVRLDAAELLGAVHVLAAADEPGLEVFERVRRHRRDLVELTAKLETISWVRSSSEVSCTGWSIVIRPPCMTLMRSQSSNRWA